MAKVFRVTKLDSTLIEKYNLIERAIKGGNYYKALKTLNEAIWLIKDDSIKKFIVAVNDENYSFLEMVLQCEIRRSYCNDEALEMVNKLLNLGAAKEHMLHYKSLIKNIKEQAKTAESYNKLLNILGEEIEPYEENKQDTINDDSHEDIISILLPENDALTQHNTISQDLEDVEVKTSGSSNLNCCCEIL